MNHALVRPFHPPPSTVEPSSGWIARSIAKAKGVWISKMGRRICSRPGKQHGPAVTKIVAGVMNRGSSKNFGRNTLKMTIMLQVRVHSSLIFLVGVKQLR